jgi:hypothetical protein
LKDRLALRLTVATASAVACDTVVDIRRAVVESLRPARRITDSSAATLKESAEGELMMSKI